MAKLTKTDKYAAQYLASQNKTTQEIAIELGFTEAQIKKFLETIEEPSMEPKIAETKADKTKNLMIRQTSAKKNNSVAIMTEGASQLGDEFTKNIPSKQRPQDHIYRRPE